MIVFIEFHDGRLFKYDINETVNISLPKVWEKHIDVMDDLRNAGHTNLAAAHDDWREVKCITLFPGDVIKVETAP